MSLYGKGYFIWKIPQVEEGDPQAIAARAVESGLSHALVKIADGADWVYNYNYDEEVDLVPAVRDALWDAGISVWGWHYVRGKDPIGEANLAINRMNELGLDGYVIDAEREFKESGMHTAARLFVQEVRKGLRRTPIALSTYRYPRTHPSFPFEVFLERCDYAMPQVYFEKAHNPEYQIERCVEQYMEMRFARPIVSTGPAYRVKGWGPTANDILRFLEKVRSLGQTAVNFWSFDFAHRDTMTEVWNAIAAFDWPPEAPRADVVDQLIGRLNQGISTHIAGLYHENAAHVTGARTVVGIDGIVEWYDVLTKHLLPNAEFQITGKSGSGNSRHFTWTATSDQGEVLDGNDTIGLRDGRIQYHYTYFTIDEKTDSV